VNARASLHEARWIGSESSSIRTALSEQNKITLDPGKVDTREDMYYTGLDDRSGHIVSPSRRPSPARGEGV